MSHKVVSLFRGMAVVTVAVLGVSALAVAEMRPEVVDRIRPVGRVAVEGQAQPTAPQPVAAAAPAAPAAPAVAETAPAAAAPAPAAAADGAGLYTAKGCMACHGPDAKSPVMTTYPKIAGLPAQYAANQMKDIKSGARSNGQSMVMKGIMAGVSDEEIQIIANWLGSL